jgi:hypothetical protein
MQQLRDGSGGNIGGLAHQEYFAALHSEWTAICRVTIDFQMPILTAASMLHREGRCPVLSDLT